MTALPAGETIILNAHEGVPPPPVAPSGSVFLVRVALSPLAPIGTLRLTLTGVTPAYAVDSVHPFGLTHAGTVTITDTSDTLVLSASEGPASRVLVMHPPAALLRLSAAIASTPPDRVTLTSLTVTLLGSAPPGHAPLYEVVRVYLYRDEGDGLLNPEDDALLAGDLAFSGGRELVVTVQELFSGTLSAHYYLAVSLTSTQAYLGQVGLAVVGATAAGGDLATVQSVTVSSLRVIYDVVPHVRVGILSTGLSALTLGASQTVTGLTLSVDRDHVLLEALALSHVAINGPPRDDDLYRVALWQESAPPWGWSAADTSLSGGSYVQGRLTLPLGFVGLTLTSAQGLSLWLRSTTHPFAQGADLNPPKALGALVQLTTTDSFVSEPATLMLRAWPLVDAPTVLYADATDLTAPVAITGEAFLALAFSLAAAYDGVGITRLLVTVAADNLQPAAFLSLMVVASAPSTGLYVLASHPPLPVASGQPATYAFTLQAPVFTEVTHWQLYGVPLPESPPGVVVQLGVGSSGLSLVGPEDTVTPFDVRTGPVRVIEEWHYATVQLAHVSLLLPPAGLTVPRGTSGIPVLRLDLQTAEPDGIARLLGLRLLRLGGGLDSDARVRLFMTPAGASGPFEGVEVGAAHFLHRVAALELSSRPFLTATPKTFWVVLDVLPSAAPGARVGLELGPSSLRFQGEFGLEPGQLPVHTPLVTVHEGAGAAVAVIVTSAPATSAAQGSAVVVATLTTYLTHGTGSVLTGLSLEVISGGAALRALRLVRVGPPSPVAGVVVVGGTGPVTLRLEEPVTAAPRRYRLEAQLRHRAPLDQVIQIRLAATGAVGPAVDTRTVNGGEGWTSPPLAIQDAPDTLTVSGRARTSRWALGAFTPALQFSLVVDHDTVRLTALTLSLVGSLPASAIEDWRLFVTPANAGVHRPVSIIHHASLIELSLHTPWTITPPLKLATLQLSLSPSVSLTQTLGLSLVGIGLAPDPVSGTVRDAAVLIGLGTGALAIRNPAEPDAPTVQLASRYSKEKTVIRAVWFSTVGHGEITDYRYAVVGGGADPDPDALAAWFDGGEPPMPVLVAPTSVGTKTSMVQTGVPLAHGGVYLVVVRARSSAGVWSRVGLSSALLVDHVKPAMPKKPLTIIKGKTQLLLTWEPPTVGPSGIARYEIERRKGTSPVWELIQTFNVIRQPQAGTSKNQQSFAPALLAPASGTDPRATAPALQPVGRELAAEPALAQYLSAYSTVVPIPREEGTFYFRVRAISGAGEVSEASPPTKVVLGLERLTQILNEVSNYPNPLDGNRQATTTIVYVLKQEARVTAELYTLLGVLVREWTFEAGRPGGEAGANEFDWDGRNGYGEPVTSGLYLLSLRAHVAGPGNTAIRKIGVVR